MRKITHPLVTLIVVVASVLLLAYKTPLQLPLLDESARVWAKLADNYLKQEIKPVEKVKHYYVAVAHLHSDREDITMQELSTLAKEGKLTILTRDKEGLVDLLGVDTTGTVSGVSDIRLFSDSTAIIRVDDLSPEFKVLRVDGKSVWDDDDYPLFARTVKKGHEEEFDRSKAVKITSVGDIMLSRTVYKKMASNGFKSPFVNVAERLSDADITFGNLESPLSDSFTPPLHGMSFVTPAKSVEGLLEAGFDIIGLANNHTGNFGPRAFTDTMAVLKQNNIEYVGGGATEAEAKSHKILNAKGIKFAFLNINCIYGDIVAKGDSPGIWHVNLEPWGHIDQKQVDEAVGKVKEAGENSDFVIVMVHWGQEYTHDPNPEMKSLARQMVDAGADLIVGTHPHWTQGVEVYKDKLITYSLGNFVFDQEWSQETKRGLILDTIFYKDKLVSVDITPVLIENYHRPRILSKEEGKPIMDDVWASSARIKAGM